MKQLQEIFNITYGNKFDLNKMTKTETKAIAFVSRSGKNNGVASYVEERKDAKPYKKGAITVALGGTVLSSFLQTKDFYTGQNVAVLTPIEELSDKEKLFYCLSIMKNKYKYSACGREANTTLKTLLVPSKEDIPSWVYEVEIKDYSDIVEPKEKEKVSLPPVSEWKTFKYEELFTIAKAQGPTATEVKKNPGKTPYVTASMENNGITGYGDFSPSHKGNCLTVGHLADVFYQPNDFSGNNVTVCVPKFENMNQQVGLFLSTLMNKNKYKYNYGRVVGITRLKEETIKVPVDENGNIDTGLITKYMNSLSYSKYL